MEYMISAYTDIGTVKQTNQDSLCVRRATYAERGEIALAVICDGMGGLSKGELASAEVIQAFSTWFDTTMEQLPALCAQGFVAIRQQWEVLIQNIHNRLLSYSREIQIQLGTTLVAWLAVGDRYLAVNVGDSRLYEHRGQLRQISQDHSLVAREVALGHITEEQALHHPQRNTLLQCLGTGTLVMPTFQEGRISGGTLYLLCSDGFVHEVERLELEQRLLPIRLDSKEVMTRTLSRIAEDCKTRGERDNITAILIKASESPVIMLESSGWRRLFSWIKKKKPSESDSQPAVTLIETAQIVYTKERL